MLNWIAQSKLVKPLGGIMLTSIILSFSISFFRAPTLRVAKVKPTVTKVLPKPSTNIKGEAPALNRTNIAKHEQTVANHYNLAQSGQNENQVAQSNIEKVNLPREETTWKPVSNANYVKNKTTPAKPHQPKSNVNVDIYLLARVIHAESRGEPFEGQVAVGAVLINRLKDSRFPNSLPQIIFKKGEFCTVRDGQIWKIPSQEAIKAARLAAAGWDPSGGALYFYNPVKTTSRWIWSRPVINRIGNHIFAA